MTDVTAQAFREAARHELKTWPEFFEPMLRGEKTFELRRGDRLFSVGDVLYLREWSPHGGYTGRAAECRVSYTLTDATFLQPGFIAMGIVDVREAQ